MNYKNRTIQKAILDHYLNHVLNAFQDYYISFFCYTFKNSFRKLSPLPAFATFFRNLKHAAVSRPSTRPINVQLLCIKENSPLSSARYMEKPPHYHGYIMLPKKYQSRFCENAVISHKMERYDTLDKDVPVLTLHEDLYKYYPSKKNSGASPILTNYDLDVRVLSEPDDVMRTFEYATKRINSPYQNYDWDEDFLLFT